MELPAEGFTWSWDGTRVTRSTCGSESTDCALTNCAPPGTYQIEICGFANPESTDPQGCPAAPESTPFVCNTVDLEYPREAPVVVYLPQSGPTAP